MRRGGCGCERLILRGEDSRPRRAGVQSVAIGMRVLQALSDMGGAANLGAITRTCAMPSPQVHRYLLSLAEAGMVHQPLPSGQCNAPSGKPDGFLRS
jgi:hypothetical protein